MKKFLIIVSIFFLAILGYAQPASLYYMTNLRQSIYTNPARMQDCGFSFSFPALNINTGVFLSTLRYTDLFSVDNNGRFFVDFDKLAANGAEYNYLYQTNQLSLFSFGVRLGYPLYIHYDMSVKTNLYLNYPQGLLDFLAYGIDENHPSVNISNLGVKAFAYTQQSISASYKINSMLTVGASIKKLTGIGMLNSKVFNMILDVDTTRVDNYPITATTEYDVYYAGPAQITYTDSLSIVPPDMSAAGIKSMILSKNSGWAFDLGFVFTPVKYVEVSGSIVDLGYINWRTNSARIFHDKTSFTFDGVDVINDTTAFDKLADTLKYLIKPNYEASPFSSGINTKLYLGVALKPVDYLSLGFAFQSVKLQPKNWLNIYHLSAAFNFAYGWSLTGTYSIYPHSYNNFGMGLALKLGFMQLYFVTDNLSIPNFGISYFTNRSTPYDQNSATLWLKKTQLANFHFGLNFNFGCKDRRDIGLLD